MHSCEGAHADMREARDAKLRLVNERNRAIDVAERPQGVRQIDHRGDARVQAEAKSLIIVAAGLEQGERAFKMIPRFEKLAGEPVGDPVVRWATPASGESGLAATSLRKAAACARIDGNSPRT